MTASRRLSSPFYLCVWPGFHVFPLVSERRFVRVLGFSGCAVRGRSRGQRGRLPGGRIEDPRCSARRIGAANRFGAQLCRQRGRSPQKEHLAVGVLDELLVQLFCEQGRSGCGLEGPHVAQVGAWADLSSQAAMEHATHPRPDCRAPALVSLLTPPSPCGICVFTPGQKGTTTEPCCSRRSLMLV